MYCRIGRGRCNSSRLNTKLIFLLSAFSDYEISYAGFEAIAFAGHCVKDEDSSELCSKTIEGVRKYVTAIQEEDDATVDKMENIFLNYGEQFKCGVLGHIRDEVFRALTRCDTITHKVISENIEIILGINDMVTDHCGRRNSELAEMEAGFEQENKRKLLKQALFDLHKKK
ncbi:uncharacterized protein LOC128547909 [Mercenaria mercenaria]|uniref:uncharacterized protein LOC128547909 n=1 Tax=Mercenaria mercenaria TaxID=6596 RepID=UPI00234E7245|nr:uncharacterized protein LOC128547909 [Mercenaria mercenaria]